MSEIKKDKLDKSDDLISHVNTLDPEMDLNNINFATGENEYLNQHPEDGDPEGDI